MGRGREKGKGRGGREGEDDLHPTIFLGPVSYGIRNNTNYN